MTKDERKAIVTKLATELSAILTDAADDDQVTERLRLALRVVIGAWTMRMIGCDPQTIEDELKDITRTIQEIIEGEAIKLIMVTRAAK